MKKLAALSLAIASVLLAAAAGAAAVTSLTPSEGALSAGLRVAGEALGETEVEALVQRKATELESRRISFVVKADDKPEKIVATATLAELGIAVDLQRTVRWARSTQRTGDFVSRMEAWRAPPQTTVDVPLALRSDRERAMRFLDVVKQTEDIDPVSARLDLATRTVVPERPGRYLDAFRATDQVFALASAMARGEPASSPDAQRVYLVAQAFPARMTTDYVKSIDVSNVIAQFETYFSRKGDQARRAKNIEVAASKLDGLILAPGELFSFNHLVGDRSEANGFEKAWEIFKGEMKEGVGGGTCQVASTFHAAALFAGIDILERLPHSRPSAYIPLGLDATVVYPVVDMKMRNPHPFPVAVHSYVEGNRVRFEILGPQKPGHVSFEREVLETIPYTRKIEEDHATPRGKVVVKQHGIRGFRIQRTREIVMVDGKRKVERTKDFYPPTVEIFKVHPSFDQSTLPPLPGDAEGSEPSAEATSTAAVAAAAVTNPASALLPTPPPDIAPDPPSVQFVDAPGAHAPSARQANPDKLLRIRR